MKERVIRPRGVWLRISMVGLLGIIAGLLFTTDASACTVSGRISNVEMVRNAELIVLVTAEGYAIAPDNPASWSEMVPTSKIRFKLVELIQGEAHNQILDRSRNPCGQGRFQRPSLTLHVGKAGRSAGQLFRHLVSHRRASSLDAEEKPAGRVDCVLRPIGSCKRTTAFNERPVAVVGPEAKQGKQGTGREARSGALASPD